MRVQDELKQSLAKNVMRNNEIYKQKGILIVNSEIAEVNIPPPDDLPQQYIVRLERPASLIMENEGEFSNLMSE